MKSHIESSVQLIMMKRGPRLVSGAPAVRSSFALPLPLALKTVPPGSQDDGEVPHGSDAQMTIPAPSVARSVKRVSKRSQISDYAGGPVLKTLRFHRRRFVRVRYLVREPRSHMPCGQKIKSSKISERIRSSGEATEGPRSTFCVGGLVAGGKEPRAVAQTWLPVMIA